MVYFSCIFKKDNIFFFFVNNNTYSIKTMLIKLETQCQCERYDG